MIKNYFTIALRKLLKHRDYALFNILGLGLSVGCGILIFALIRHQTSFDTYHKNADRVVRVLMDVKTDRLMPFSGVPLPMANTLRAECPIVEKAAMRSAEYEVLISVDNKSGGKNKYKEEEKFAWIEPELLDILDLPILRGNREALLEPNTTLLSEKLARKYFGNEEPLGQSILLNNKTNLRVVGILRDLPNNTDYKHEILASFATLKTLPDVAPDLTSWAGARGDNFCLALLQKGHTVAEMEPVMAQFRKNHPHPDDLNLFQYKSIAMAGLHFDPDYGNGMDKKYLWALGFIGLFLLITACVNFINMATAQALTRIREVGVRKSLGSTRGQLFWQFMFETGLIVMASLLVGFLLAQGGMPYLNKWLKNEIVFDAALMSSLLGFMAVLGVSLTFLAGFYPGFMQSRFNPVLSMKGASEIPVKGGFSLRRVLVTTQFAISQILIIGAAIVTAQMQYAREADWGFRPGAVVILNVPESAKGKNLQQELSAITGVKSVSLCYQPPVTGSNNHTGIRYDNRPEPENWLVNDKAADANYLETFGLKLAAGRNLQPSDTTVEFLVNETFVKKLNLASPEEILNKIITVSEVKAPVVGVVKDFHNFSMAQAISPILIGSRVQSYITCAVQLNPGNPAPVLAQIQQAWERQYPDNFYEHRFMDEKLGEFMETETMLLRLVSTFAGIAIFIGCLGLYGLAAFMVTRKRKEIGIRKSLGANVPGILWLFGKEYARLIVIAFVLAAPIAWWVMEGWLADYAYRVSIGAGVFIISLAATIAVAVATVGVQSVRAALANPVKALRNE